MSKTNSLLANCVVPEAGLYNLSVKSTKNKTGVVDLFAVDGRQTISIHETDGRKLCDNKHSIDSNAHFPNANAIDWHPKEGSILASGGYDGFVYFGPVIQIIRFQRVSLRNSGIDT